MNKISPTNLIADARAFFAVVLCAFVTYKLVFDASFNAEKMATAVTAVWLLIDRLLGSVAARYTADADATNPPLKTDSATAAKTGLLFLLGFFALGLTACHTATTSAPAATATATTRQRIIAVAGQVPVPSDSLAVATRAKVAAIVKREVQAHPFISGWVNELAKVCFRFSSLHLPSASLLNAGFYTAELVAPKSVSEAIRPTADALLKFYGDNLAVAQAIQTAGTPYLSIIGSGIQDGIAQAGVDDAP